MVLNKHHLKTIVHNLRSEIRNILRYSISEAFQYKATWSNVFLKGAKVDGAVPTKEAILHIAEQRAGNLYRNISYSHAKS